MVCRSPRFFCALLAACAFLISLPGESPAQSPATFQWRTRRFEGRDYVPISQVAAFYGLDPAAAGGTAQFVSGHRSLAFRRESREAGVNGLKNWLAFPAIERESELWISRIDLSKTIEPALRPHMAPGAIPPALIILDPGHGGSDRGATGLYQYEKNFTLDVARRVRNRLVEAGARVLLTRNSDSFVELHERAALANAHPNAILVSLHFNAGKNPAANGFEVFSITPRGSPSTEYEDLVLRDMVHEPGNSHDEASYLLSNAIYHAMHGKLQMLDRGVKRARFAVLRLASMPAVLIEGGFLTNPQDARRIASPRWRTDYANAIADGILAYARLAREKIPPPLASEYRAGLDRPLRTKPPPPAKSSTPPSLSLRPLPDAPHQ